MSTMNIFEDDGGAWCQLNGVMEDVSVKCHNDLIGIMFIGVIFYLYAKIGLGVVLLFINVQSPQTIDIDRCKFAAICKFNEKI